MSSSGEKERITQTPLSTTIQAIILLSPLLGILFPKLLTWSIRILPSVSLLRVYSDCSKFGSFALTTFNVSFVTLITMYDSMLMKELQKVCGNG